MSFPRTPLARWRWPSDTAAGARATSGSVPSFDGLRSVEAAAIISKELARDDGWLSPACVAQLFDCYGLPLITTRVVADAEQAVAAAAELGAPVALKASASGLVHKTDAGGVRLGLEGPDAVRAAAARDRRTRSRAPATGSTAWSCSRWRPPGSS